MVGPVVQNYLFSIVMRFCKHSIILAADVKMMYRQILIDPNQRKLQQIFWRSDSHEFLKSYELNSVTYGTASALYLATRCLKQLAIEYESSHPRASRIIANDFYADDLLTGGNTVEEVCSIRDE